MQGKTNVLDAVAKLQQKLAADRHRDYCQLASRLVKGEDISPEDVVAALDATGVPAEQLQADMERLARRYELAALMKSADAHQQELARLRAEIKKHDDALAAAEERHEKATYPLRVAVGVATDKAVAADQAKADLRRTTAPALLAKADGCRGEADRLLHVVATRRERTEYIARANADLGHAPDTERTVFQTETDEMQRRAEVLLAEADRLDPLVLLPESFWWTDDSKPAID